MSGVYNKLGTWHAIVKQLKKSLPENTKLLYLDMANYAHPVAIIKMGNCFAIDKKTASTAEVVDAGILHDMLIKKVRDAVEEAKEQLHKDRHFDNVLRFTANVYCKCTEVS